MSKNRRLQILMNGKLVGWLTKSTQGILSFHYEDSWLEYERSRPISLSLQLSKEIYSGSLVENYFDNLLPDSIPIRNRLQTRVGAKTSGAFDLLAQIGRDCVGALQLVPEGEKIDVKKVTATPQTNDEIAKVLANYKAMPLGIDLDSDFRISVAGAQEKTAFLLLNDQWHKPSGATPTSHIFKLPIGELGQSGVDLSGSVENEYLCQKLLKGFGVPVAEAKILKFEEQKVLSVKRFDRKWSSDNSWLIRLPQEDMCQATGTPGHLKYENDSGPGMRDIMDLLLGSMNEKEDRAIFMQTQLLFWMLGAIDGHAKNFSIFHLPGGLFQLTPMYDVISIYPVVDSKQISIHKACMAMAVSGKSKHYKLNNITKRHWLETARRCRFAKDEMNNIIEKCCDLVDHAINEAAAEIPKEFPEQIADSIFNGIKKAKKQLQR